MGEITVNTDGLSQIQGDIEKIKNNLKNAKSHVKSINVPAELKCSSKVRALPAQIDAIIAGLEAAIAWVNQKIRIIQ